MEQRHKCRLPKSSSSRHCPSFDQHHLDLHQHSTTVSSSLALPTLPLLRQHLLSSTAYSLLSCFDHRLPKSLLFRLLFILLFVFPPIYAQALNPLNHYIEHYEPLSYNHKPVLAKLHRSRRSTSSYEHYNDADPEYEIVFHSHDRHFNLRLKRDIDSVFHSNMVIEDSDGQPISVNLDHLVTGHLHGQPNSLAYGSIRNGVFEGKIHSTLPNEEVFYVEKSHKYFTPDAVDIFLLDKSNMNGTHSAKYNLYHIAQSIALSRHTSPAKSLAQLPFHSVIYSSKHVVDPHRSKRSPLDGACGADAKTREWMDSIANSAVEKDDEMNLFSNTTSSRGRRSTNYHYNYRNPFGAQRRISDSRLSTQSPTLARHFPQKRACSLYIQTDTFLWDHVKKHESEKSDFKVREEIASLVAQHIKAVNHIYETSMFKDIIGLKFIVQRLRINDSSSCEHKKRESNHFCSPNIDVSNFLNLNSQFNHNDFCLAYIFTYRDFSGGTLGLAWVASTSGASGGICEKYKTYTENIGGRQVQTKRSLNTGIITFVNYNSRVPPKVSELTLAHEIGHNFGSPHDYPMECRPGGPLGNFIMYSSATSGERQNNNKFSYCSINNISSVLRAVFNNEGKENCFQVDNGPFCGNKIVEGNEECDCGYDSRECDEDCCYPRNVEDYKKEDPFAQPCKRRPGALCSPSQGPCCTEKCTYEGVKKRCREDDECTHDSFCDGQLAHCPFPQAKPNRTTCNMGTQVCWKGACTGSICQKYDLEECFLNAKRGAKADEMCEVACQKLNQPDTCRRTSEIKIMQNVSGLKLRPGSPCNDFQGYCDVFQRCRPVDAEGPLARLKNLLFNKKTLTTIKQWVTTYWWACTLMLFGAILFMAAFIKCCAVHTPSSNPKRKKALRITDTLRRPADTLRRKSRERSQASSSRHRSNRERSSTSQNSRPVSNPSSQQMLLTSSHPQPSQTHHHHHNVPYQSTSVTSPLTQSNAAPNPSTQYPPTLVVNLPPADNPPQLHDPPPPYPGLPKASAPPLNGGPSHGYGEGRGHYNRQGQTNVPTSVKPPGPKSNVKKSEPESSKSRRS